jgi:hypothetical protein
MHPSQFHKIDPKTNFRMSTAAHDLINGNHSGNKYENCENLEFQQKAPLWQPRAQ